MQAAFVDIGLERTAFLYVDDIHDNILDLEWEHFNSHGETDVGSFEQPELSSQSHEKKIKAPIDGLIQEGQYIMVQIAKEPIGEKGARLTSYLSIPGRNLVLMPTVDHIGISRLIADPEKKNRLKKIIREIRPENYGFIARTVSENASKETLQSEMDFLVKSWTGIQYKMGIVSGTGLLHQDLNLSLRSVRDLFTHQIHKLIIDSPREYETLMDFIHQFTPAQKFAAELYDGRHPIFDFYGIEQEIERAVQPRVQLKSGAHIVIEKTEALTSIDVNTGRFVGGSNLEETILQTNLEAIKEIARQLRLRSIGGIIIIDFISMQNSRHNEIVYDALNQALSADKAKTNVLPMSELGLIEMTRKRTRPSLRATLTEPCMYCKGDGRLKSKKEICYELLRDIEKENIFADQNDEIIVHANPLIQEIFADKEMESILSLEKRLMKRIHIVPKEDYHLAHYKIYT